ncbi:MAG: purine-nucleoside phosphorylase [Clostridia bacterium]|nr:purine-nucleoside phosphorylase [Clostridia bacterium]
MEQKLNRCLEKIRKITDFVPRVGVVLGSGLGSFAEKVQMKETIPYASLPHFPVSTVKGHTGQFVLGGIGEVPVVLMQGRVHYYEGYDMQDVVLPVRLMGRMGAKTILLTNAAGGINPAFAPGDLMLISDHISTFVPSPLRGENIESLGTRFPDMSEVYSRALSEKIRKTAKSLGVPLKEGIYLQAPGPQYETPAEIRAFRTLGADAVGMSTACEAIAARHMGLEVAGISCVSNPAAGLGSAPLSHGEVQAAAKRVEAQFSALLHAAIASL